MQTKIISVSAPQSKMFSEIFLISLAVAFQFFSCTGLYYIRSYADQANPSSMLTTFSALTSAFLFSWYVFSFIGRISGAYFLGKYSNRDSFFKITHFISIGHIFVAGLIVTICNGGDSYYHNYHGFYLARFFYSSLSYATIILPTVYLLDKYNESRHILISTYIVLAVFLGKFLAYIFSCYGPAACMHVWYWLPVIGSFLAWGIYAYVEKHSSPSVKKIETIIKSRPSSFQEKIIGMLIGVACNAGIDYYYFFLTPYLQDIVILQNYDFPKMRTLFYIAFGMFLLPAAKICQKFGAIKTMIISLNWMLILGISIPFLPLSNLAYVIPQIVFTFFLASFAAPSLTILNKIFKNTKSMFDILFWFSLGSSISMLSLGVGSRIGFILHYPLTGMLIFAASILMCLIGIVTYSHSKCINFKSANVSAPCQSTTQKHSICEESLLHIQT